MVKNWREAEDFVLPVKVDAGTILQVYFHPWLWKVVLATFGWVLALFFLLV